MLSRTCTRLCRHGRSNLYKSTLLKSACLNGLGFRFESDGVSMEDNFDEEKLTLRTPSRPHWREEVNIPDYAAKHVRKACQKYVHRDREQQWKKYLEVVRSRDAHKDFIDWGEGDVSSGQRMNPIMYDEFTSTVYSEYRIAKNYAVLSRILTDISYHLPQQFSPHRYLDIGCGCGASSLPVLERFNQINDVVLVDSSEYMVDMASSLIQKCNSENKQGSLSLSTYPSLLSVVEQKEKNFDFILMDRFLSELPSNKARASAIIIAWELLQPGGLMIVSEEGSRWGFHLTRCARSLVLHMEATTQNASVVSPCPHLEECPLKGNKKNWCHFCQQSAPGPTAEYKSRRRAAEVFSYVALRKAASREESFYRVMNTPLKRNKHVIIDVCCPSGAYERKVFSKGKLKEDSDKYREIRKAEWGGELSLYNVCNKQLILSQELLSLFIILFLLLGNAKLLF